MESKKIILGFAGLAIFAGGYLIYKKKANNAERQDLYKKIYAQIVVFCPSFIEINNAKSANNDKILQMKQQELIAATQSKLFSANGIIRESKEVMKPKLVKDTYTTDSIGINACAYDINSTLMPTFEKMSISELKLILAYYKNMDILNDSVQHLIYINLFKKYHDSGISLQD